MTVIVRRVYKPFVMHLSDYMAEKSLSDEVVAAAIGRSRVSVSRYRRKLVRPDWAAIEKIREYSGGQVTPNDWQEIGADAAAVEAAE